MILEARTNAVASYFAPEHLRPILARLGTPPRFRGGPLCGARVRIGGLPPDDGGASRPEAARNGALGRVGRWSPEKGCYAVVPEASPHSPPYFLPPENLTAVADDDEGPAAAANDAANVARI